MTCTTNTRSTLDHRLIADRVLCRREELRSIPYEIHTAAELARAMIQEQEWFDLEDGRSPYNTTRALDAVLALIDRTAMYLGYQIEDVIGEHDGDLPTIEQPAPRPAVEVSPEEQRAVWERIAAQAAAELAKLDAADQGGDTIPAAIIRAYLDLAKSPVKYDENTVTAFRRVESDLLDAITAATGIDSASLCTYGELIQQGDGLLLLGQGETRVLSIDAEGRITRLDADQGEADASNGGAA